MERRANEWSVKAESYLVNDGIVVWDRWQIEQRWPPQKDKADKLWTVEEKRGGRMKLRGRRDSRVWGNSRSAAWFIGEAEPHPSIAPSLGKVYALKSSEIAHGEDSGAGDAWTL